MVKDNQANLKRSNIGILHYISYLNTNIIDKIFGNPNCLGSNIF